ncbi:MAG: cytochrome-c peroxidase, partial [Paracoccaceae bacterium]
MKRYLASAIALSAAMTAPAFADDAALREMAKDTFEAIPLQAPMLENNVLSRDRVDLGAMLFFDPRMSKSGLFSCQSCHNVGIGGVDGLETSVGHGWQAGPRNAPTMLNAVFNVAQFWDGRAPDLAAQAKGPVQAGVEMNNTP